MCRYTLSKTYELSAPRLNRRQLFVGYAGEASDITYSVEFGEAAQGANVGRGGESLLELPGTASTTVGGLERPASPGKFFVDSSSGEILARPSVSGNFIAILRARDGAGASVVVKEWSFVVQGADTATAANGPNGRGCANGEAVDSDELDRLFTCDCSRTSYSGGNCDVPAATASPSEVVAGSADSGVIVAAILVPLLALVIGAALVSRCRAHAKKNAPMDFNAQLQFLKDQGLIDEEEGDRGELPRVPRELKRGWLSLVERIGEGAFGVVWKGLLVDNGASGCVLFVCLAGRTHHRARARFAWCWCLERAAANPTHPARKTPWAHP